MFWQPYLIGLGMVMVLLSPIEWFVHKYILHAPKPKRNLLTRAPSRAHNDIHHGSYKGPMHYYRDITNEHETVHFSIGNVALVLGIGGALGFMVSRIYAFLWLSGFSLTIIDLGMTLGFITGAAIGYIGYEVSHHYMHVIGERRLAINRKFGDLLQGGIKCRDGLLRFSKPFLDSVCNSIEDYVDTSIKQKKHLKISVDSSLKRRFAIQYKHNTKTLRLKLEKITLENVVSKVASGILVRERLTRKPMHFLQRRVYAIHRAVQKLFRGSETIIGKYFRHIDNHHFLHHTSFQKNLNVFITWADRVFGTIIDSSANSLEDTRSQKYFLCPNSPLPG